LVLNVFCATTLSRDEFGIRMRIRSALDRVMPRIHSPYTFANTMRYLLYRVAHLVIMRTLPHFALT